MGITLVVVVLFFWKIEWVMQAITPREETFTELYFEDHLHLPKTLKTGVPFQLSFTIHNLEGKDMKYPVSISAISDTEPPIILPLLETSVEIDKNISKTLQVELTLPASSSAREKVQIELVDLNQSIHFWSLVTTPSATPKATQKR